MSLTFNVPFSSLQTSSLPGSNSTLPTVCHVRDYIWRVSSSKPSTNVIPKILSRFDWPTLDTVILPDWIKTQHQSFPFGYKLGKRRKSRFIFIHLLYFGLIISLHPFFSDDFDLRSRCFGTGMLFRLGIIVTYVNKNTFIIREKLSSS